MNLPKKMSDFSLGSIFKNTDIQKIKPYLLTVYGILILAISYNIFFAKRIIPGVSVAGIRVGGMTFSQAKKTLEENEKSISPDLKIKFEDKEFPVKGSEVGLEYDWENSVALAFEVGRSGNFFVDSRDKFLGFFKNLNLPASYDFDDDSLGIKLSIIRGEVNVEPQKSGLHFVNGNLEAVSSSSGRKIMEEDFYKKVMSVFGNLDFSDIEIPVTVVEPEISEKDAQLFLGVVKEIISEDLVLTFEDKKWVLGSNKILELVEINKDSKGGRATLNLNEASFENLSNELSLEINKFPRGQVISMDGDKVTEFKIVGEGKELDENKFREDLRVSIFDDRKPVALTVNIVTESKNSDKYGIVALLGEGTSHFSGSSSGRIHNLILAAENTSGVLVPPGATYSMNDSVGPIDFQHGFQSAYIIKGGRTILGEGGGVCQTSTTLFRAVLNSGLPVVSRYPHAYRVGYYEQDMPVGFDAAIFQPSWDFKFKNDTSAYVLVQTYSNLQESTLTFKLYGTPDGRQVEISTPVVTDQSPPPESLYEDDPNLKKGVVQQVDFAAWGATSTFTRTVKKGNDVLFTDTFTSKYQPWRAVFRVGTKE